MGIPNSKMLYNTVMPAWIFISTSPYVFMAEMAQQVFCARLARVLFQASSYETWARVHLDRFSRGAPVSAIVSLLRSTTGLVLLLSSTHLLTLLFIVC
jgi:hypothetical protein